MTGFLFSAGFERMNIGLDATVETGGGDVMMLRREITFIDKS